MTLRAFSESVELSASLWAFSESVSPQLVHGTLVSLWTFNVVIYRALCESEGPQQLYASMSLWIFSESLDFQ